jgi:hypothetical protein
VLMCRSGSLGFLTPSPLRKQQARNSSSPRGEHMAGGRKALSALSLMASLAPIGHASFCSDLDTARKVPRTHTTAKGHMRSL